MIALLDLDLYAYRCAASAEGEATEEVAILRCDKWLRETLYELDTKGYQGFLTGKNNFRKTIYPEYKANRTQPKPRYLEATREFLIEDWDAQLGESCEADDLLGINQNRDTVLVSNDKDLLQVPGLHYNPVKKEFIEIGEYEGLYNFWSQMLTGDRSDNVPGFDGVMRAKPPKFIEKMLSDMVDFEQEVFDLYEDKSQFFVNYNLLHIWRRGNDYQCPQVIQKLLTGQNPYKQGESLTLESLLSIKTYLSQLSANTVTDLETGISALGTQTEDI